MTNILLNYYNFDGDWTQGKLQKYMCGAKPLIIPLAYRDVQAWDDNSWQALYGTNGEKYNAIISPFLHYGIDINTIQWLNFYRGDQVAKQQIEQSNLLFFCGGLPEKAIARMQELNIVKDVQNFCGTIMGASAGAMLQLKKYHITPDDDYDSYGIFNGLGLVDGIDIEVHYEATEIQQVCAARAAEQLNVPVYAIYHQGGVIVENGIVQTMGQTVVFKNK